jgi:pimeloyl-ACP methyl ester carboxylesterase
MRFPLFLLLVALLESPAHASCDYTGSFRQPDGAPLKVYHRAENLILRPAFWTAEQVLTRTVGDRFVVADRPDRTATFERDSHGCVASVTLTGFRLDGILPRLDGRTAVDLLFDHQPAAAAALASKSDRTAAIQWGEQVLGKFPSRARDAADYLVELAGRVPADSNLERLIGDALVATSRRTEAIPHYEAALRLDPADDQAATAMRMLGKSRSALAGWTLPFALDSLFTPPEPPELAEVVRQWKARDLRPTDVKVIDVQPYDLGRMKGEIRFISHRIQGSLHYGAVIVPAGAGPKSCAVVIDAKGVSPTYDPRRLDTPPDSISLEAEDQARYVTFVPSYRGEQLIFRERTLVSEGDRMNVWDGATDDALAFLDAALRVTPEADPARIGIFGRSRGGTVALLAAIRDPRIRVVVAWAAPTDHFVLMGSGGWSRREIVEEGLRQKSPPTGIGGQFIETFLARAIARERGLEDVRQLLISSSPLYFAARLPEATQLHYGADDPVVGARNGRAIAAERAVESHFYPGFGHDTDRIAAAESSRRFLASHLACPTSCR